MKNNIILTGMMGAGKTVIGKLLKENIPDFNFIDTDELIETNCQMSISEIFKQKGEKYFRQLEQDVISEICEKDKQIISLGGGVFENENNRKVLNENGMTIYLKATPETIYERIKHETQRPLLQDGFGKQRIVEILKKREENYSKALLTIDTNGRTPYNIVKEILEKINYV